MNTQAESNEIIHRWMGECWHEWEKTGIDSMSLVGLYRCVNKNCNYYENKKAFTENFPSNPDYFTPEGFFQIKEKLEGMPAPFQNKSAMVHFPDAPFLDYHYSNPDSLPNKLVEWIKEGE